MRPRSRGRQPRSAPARSGSSSACARWRRGGSRSNPGWTTSRISAPRCTGASFREVCGAREERRLVAMNAGLLLLRLVLGLTMAAHGSQKLFGSFGGGGIEGTKGFMASLGYRLPLAMAVLAGCSEFFGGLAFAAGLATPLAALALVVVMC